MVGVGDLGCLLCGLLACCLIIVMICVGLFDVVVCLGYCVFRCLVGFRCGC